MKPTSLQHPTRPKSPAINSTAGFTLVEILVVAMLISLFAGIAIISISYMTVQSKRKAANADARSISDAMTIVQMRHNVLPKFGYLSMTTADLANLVTPQGMLPPSFDYYGLPLTFPQSAKILKTWEGPFLPSFAGRTVTGKTGVVKMRMPEQPADTPTRELMDWPADYWGNPYVLYVIQNPSKIMCVVSYGPNGIPGGGDPITASLNPAVDFSPGEVEQIRQLGRFYRLFRQEGDHFVALTAEEVESDPQTPPLGPPVNHLLALRSSLIIDGAERGYMEGTPLAKRVPGILDAGSDDLVVHLH